MQKSTLQQRLPRLKKQVSDLKKGLTAMSAQLINICITILKFIIMKLNLECIRHLLIIAEKYESKGNENYSVEIVNDHINYLIKDDYIFISNNYPEPEEKDEKYKIGNLTVKGQNFLSVFRDVEFTKKIVTELSNRNTDSLEIAKNIAVQLLSTIQ